MGPERKIRTAEAYEGNERAATQEGERGGGDGISISFTLPYLYPSDE